MAHTADVKLWRRFPSKTRYFSLVSGTKIEKKTKFLVFWALVPWSCVKVKYLRKSDFLDFKGVFKVHFATSSP